ncbi:MAG: extracellular solute-binding protein [Chloroflexota bacterium]|nr:extracellular solute-binding protein [Chloroflexota bacterium]
MSQEIEFSTMTDSAAQIQPLIDQFTAQTGISVRLRLLTWDTAWSDLARIGLYGDGADVSEVGSTWLGDLVAMHVLQPFSADEIAGLGGAAAFLPSAWAGTQLVGQSETWAIPWMTGARLLVYRRHLLEAAGVDERSAFGSVTQFEQTVARLHEAGGVTPWLVPTGITHTTLLNVASWVWGSGGDFVTPDGRRTLFSAPAARAGLRAYFALGRYLTPAVRHLRRLQPDEYFVQHADAALTISGPWLVLNARSAATAGAERLGIALPPGASFVGGSSLVIWQRSRQHEAALAWIRFLTQTAAQVEYSRLIGLLPVRRAALEAWPFTGDPLWQRVREGVAGGRSFPVTPTWGLLEYRLAATFGSLWTEILTQAQPNLDALLVRYLDPLAERLDAVLKQ